MFYELGYRIELRPGDAIFFKSKQLLHGNAPLKNALDQQFSLTFFTKRRDFHYEEPDVTIEEEEFGPEEVVGEGKWCQIIDA